MDYKNMNKNDYKKVQKILSELISVDEAADLFKKPAKQLPLFLRKNKIKFFYLGRKKEIYFLENDILNLLLGLVVSVDEAANILTKTKNVVSYLKSKKVPVITIEGKKYYMEKDVLPLNIDKFDPLPVIEKIMISYKNKGVREVKIKDIWAEISKTYKNKNVSIPQFEKSIKYSNKIFIKKGEYLIYTNFEKNNLRRAAIHRAIQKYRNDKDVAKKLNITIKDLKKLKKDYKLN
jgi:hypothetical protein